MEETIMIEAKVTVWQQYMVKVPEGMSKEEFVKHLKETDPAANGYENEGIEYLDNTEETLIVEYFNVDEVIASGQDIRLLGRYEY